jgi:hypothetical protein
MKEDELGEQFGCGGWIGDARVQVMMRPECRFGFLLPVSQLHHSDELVSGLCCVHQQQVRVLMGRLQYLSQKVRWGLHYAPAPEVGARIHNSFIK